MVASIRLMWYSRNFDSRLILSVEHQGQRLRACTKSQREHLGDTCTAFHSAVHVLLHEQVINRDFDLNFDLYCIPDMLIGS